ncbi:palmitoyltransferase for Vac8p [Vanrija albida]|uniref:Palmitoyltransferase n=1 Tax=Vanrija albida TaxID=181172 RepID=A0ABR3Q5H7_9TREE
MSVHPSEGEASNHSHDTVRRIVKRLPVVGAWLLLFIPSALFIGSVSVYEVLLQRHEVGRFLCQVVIYTALLFMSIISFSVACARRPIRPDKSLTPQGARPLKPDEGAVRSQHRQQRNGRIIPRITITDASVGDDDDIPLRLLRPAAPRRSPPSYSEQPPPIAEEGQVEPQSAEARGNEYRDDDEDDSEDRALLAKDEEENVGMAAGQPLMAKLGTGGHRWCRKCDGWKPDRCHHCRACGQCVLKMDHHCPWLDNCVGYHNYKAFMLFVTYAALMAGYGASQAGMEAYRFFNEPGPVNPGPYAAGEMDETWETRISFLPVLHMLLAIVGGTLTLAVGVLAAYHWYLVLNNRSTLEDFFRNVPTALLDSETRGVVEELGARGSRYRTPGAWRPDHILTRPERTRLRREARAINVFDMGWRYNLRSVMLGDAVASAPPGSWKQVAHDVASAAWPLSRPRMKAATGGHYFDYDKQGLERLKSVTTELRLGLKPGALPPSRSSGHSTPQNVGGPHVPGYHVERNNGNQWTIGESESESGGSDDE